jgi:glutathione S-transferase
MESLHLYVQPGCPYCKKVTLVLDRMDLPYDTTSVSRSHRNRDEVQAVSGQTGVPVFTDPNTDVEGMPESEDIIDYLEATYEYPEGVSPNRGLRAKLLSMLP